ncbi:biosynthetic arginine decarboxylase [Pelagibaculum spongiae]|uniref:Arginine decarboxylase n=1 Tax=Pelagibaculum spongiae TaxID=2080658 RepID=A0A2V1GVC7_9GAMM|nr:biosynthetic arginine decarboxylase [Pelagibaculum spongiae]PVZ70288.1 arginine decarboxylase [Pelagibaculum spongiae]
MSEWSIEQSRQTYNIARWSEGYFDISQQGHLIAKPNHHCPDVFDDQPENRSPTNRSTGIDLPQLMEEIQQSGLRLPVLVRFTDILDGRVRQLCSAFDKARKAFSYQGSYSSVYPIKTNQQRHLVEGLLKAGGNRLGLEAGSKPELLAVLGLLSQQETVHGAISGRIIVCNGYKDREYIRLALIAQQLGHQVYLVVEKLSELEQILQEGRVMNIQPVIGLRTRLSTVSSGQWQNTGGEKGKFGLTAGQLIQAMDILKQQQSQHCLKLLHFHMGSQISDIHEIRRGVSECARYYAELRRFGAPIDIVDVGGGLGVDYEGTGSNSHFSTNYTIDDYASQIVRGLAEACNREKQPQPTIFTESGRGLSAHHAVLITNVIDREIPDALPVSAPAASSPLALQLLWQKLQQVNSNQPLQAFSQAEQALSEIAEGYLHGEFSLVEKAQAEAIWMQFCRQLLPKLDPARRPHRPILDQLNEKLAHRLFCNLSLFQSLPDVWGIGQVFPVMPLQGLDQPPAIRARLQDITCDSDGRIDDYADGEGVESTLPLPLPPKDKPQLLAFFLVGAYQEILGDMHNLFGDTDSVHVELTATGYQLVQPKMGDTVEDLLEYVNYDAKELLNSLEASLNASNLDPADKQCWLGELREGFRGYTYLED